MLVKQSNFRNSNEENQNVRKEPPQAKPHEDGSNDAALRNCSNLRTELSG
jgi:hypothetical protein